MDNHDARPVSEEQLATDSYYRRESQFSSRRWALRGRTCLVDAPLVEAVFYFFQSIWSRDGKEVGDRVEGEGDRMDLIKMHYMHIGNSQQ